MKSRVFDALRQIGRAATVSGIGVVLGLVLFTPRQIEAVPISVHFGDLSQAGFTISGVTGVWDLTPGIPQTVGLATIDVEHEEPFAFGPAEIVTPDFNFSLPLEVGGESQTLSFRYFGEYRQVCPGWPLSPICTNWSYSGHLVGLSAPTEFLISDLGPSTFLVTLEVDRWNGPWNSLRRKIGEVRMAVSPSDPDVLYVLIKTFESSKALGLWRTGNAWDPSPTWTKIPIEFGLGAGPALLVHPTDPNVLYLANAGDAVFRHDPNGWTSITQLDPFDVLSEDLIHVDQRALAWAGGERLLVGNDGGLYLKDVAHDGPWLPRNEGLSTIQFYAGAVTPDDATMVLGGAQDNGTGLLVPPAGKTWKSIFSGDGMNGFFGPAPQQLALSVQHGWVGRSLDGGATITGALNGFTTQETSPGWMTQVVRCPADPDTVLYAGFRLWKSTNFFSAPSKDSIVWTPMSGTGWFIRAIAFAPSDPSCETYAFARFDGTLELTTSDGAAWTELNPGSELPERIPTELAFSPVSADTLWLTLSGFDSQTPGQPGHVFRTDDATSASPTWANVSPPADLPHNAVAVHPTDSQMVFVGCDLGAWITTDGGATWKHNGPSIGLPNVPVMDLHVGKCSATAFTFGRGAFRTVSLVGPLCVE